MQTRRVLALSTAVLLVATAWPVHAQRNTNTRQQQQQRRSPQEQADIDVLFQLVDTALAADLGISLPPLFPAGAAPAPGDAAAKPASSTPAPAQGDRVEGQLAVKWESAEFIKGQGGDTYIPFTLTVDPALAGQPASLFIRIANKEQSEAFKGAVTAKPEGNKPPSRPMFAWENVYFIDIPKNGRLTRAIQLPGGDYVAYIALKERAAQPAGNQRNRNDERAAQAAFQAASAQRYGLVRRQFTVPNFNTNELTTSSVILATAVEPVQGQLSPQEQEANPYVFGPMRIVPNEQRRYSKNGELSVIFWIYGATPAAGGKPDVQVEYNFHHVNADGTEKYFNRTAPQQLNAETLPPEFNVAAGHQLPGSLVVPLASFPAGDYRLEIKVTDKPSGRSVTRNVNFTVLPV